MAITLTDSPNDLTVKGQKLFFVCTSSNLSEDNFKFIVVIKDEAGTQIAKYYKSPNLVGRLLFNLRPVINELIKVDVVDSQQSDGIIHNMPHAVNQQFTVALTGMQKFEVEIGEFYDDPGGDEHLNLASRSVYLNAGCLQYRDGYKNPLLDYQSNDDGTTKAFLLDRETELHKESGLTGVTIKTNNLEYGCVSWFYSASGLIGDNSPIVKYSIYNASGLVSSVSYLYVGNGGGPAAGSSVAKNQQAYGAFYPGNISNADSFYTDTPATVANWTYYTIQLFTNEEADEASLPLIFVNDCAPTKHSPAQLAWTNSVGGWEYLTFNGRVKNSISSSSKNYTRDMGDYNITTYSFNTFDRQETSFHIDSSLSYTLYRQNASDVDSRLLASLAKSQNVMVSLNNTVQPEWLPVIVESPNFNIEPSVSSKNLTLSVKIKLAQQEQC